MNKIGVISLMLAACVLSGTRGARAQASPAAAVIPGEFVYSLRPGKSVDQLLASLSNKKLKAKLLGFSERTRTALVRLEGVGTLAEVNATLQNTEDIDEVLARSPNLVYSLTEGPNDPLIQKAEYFKQVNALNGWEHISTGSSVVVAVLDTGILTNHEDIRKNLWTNPSPVKKSGASSGPVGDIHGWNFVDNNSNVNPKDTSERHGTNVAGIIAAVGNNSTGSAGIAWKSNVKIMPVRMCSTDCKLFNAISAVNYAVDRGARIINMSWGGLIYDDQLMLALDSARKNNVLVVASAGNGNAEGLGQDNDAHPFYPASYKLDNIISVAAVNRDDTLAPYSNYGKASVHIAAPGTEIIGPVPIEGKGGQLNSGYRAMSGTSQAAPVISGIAAVLFARHPELSASKAREIIMSAGDKQPALVDRTVSGARANVDAAISQSDSAQLASSESVAAAEQIDIVSVLEKKPKQQFGDFSKLARARGSLPLPTTYAWTSGGRKELHDAPVSREYVVTLQPGVDVETVRKALPPAIAIQTSKTLPVFDTTNQFKIMTNSSQPETEVTKALNNITGVERVSPNRTYQLQKSRN